MFEHDDDPDFWAEERTRPLPRPLGRLGSRLRPAGTPPPQASRPWPSRANLRTDAGPATAPVRRAETAVLDTGLLDATLEFHLDDFDPFDGYEARSGAAEREFGARTRSRSRTQRAPRGPRRFTPPDLTRLSHGARRIGLLVAVLVVAAPVAWALRDDGSSAIAPADAAASTPVDAVVASPTPMPAIDATAACGLAYTVVAGDYWISIADRAGVGLDALLAANGATTDTMLLPGNSICLPAGASVPAPTVAPPATAATPAAAPAVATPAPACGQSYMVRSGDSWSGIASRADVTTTQLLAANGATTRTVLLPGRSICLPVGASIAVPATAAPAPSAPPQTVACTKRYTVVSGDSWSGIASKVSITTTQLLAANNATTRTVLLPGRSICLPANATVPTAPRPTTPSAPSTPYVPPRTYSQAEVIQIIRDVWPDNLEAKAIEIAYRESRYNPLSQNWCCYGVFQIYFTVHQRWLAGYGVTSANQLLDPHTNIRMALVVYQRSNSWAPWGG